MPAASFAAHTFFASPIDSIPPTDSTGVIRATLSTFFVADYRKRTDDAEQTAFGYLFTLLTVPLVLIHRVSSADRPGTRSVSYDGE